MKKSLAAWVVILMSFPVWITAQEESDEQEKGRLDSRTFEGLSLRGIGPALMSGRIGDLAVHPQDRHRTRCSGGSQRCARRRREPAAGTGSVVAESGTTGNFDRAARTTLNPVSPAFFFRFNVRIDPVQSETLAIRESAP